MTQKEQSKAGRNETNLKSSNNELDMSSTNKNKSKVKIVVISMKDLKEKIFLVFSKGSTIKKSVDSLYKRAKHIAGEAAQTITQAAASNGSASIKKLKDSILANRIVIKYTAAIVVTVLLVTLIVNLNLRPVVVVNVNNRPVAVVPSKQYFETAVSKLQKNWKEKYGKDVTLVASPTFRLKILPKKFLSTQLQLVEAVQADTNLFEKAYAISINGQKSIFVKDYNAAVQALANIKKRYSSGAGDEKVEFVENVQIVSTYAAPSEIIGLDQAVDALTKNADTTKEYAAQEGDTLWSIAKRSGIAIERLFELNPNVGDDIKLGQVIRLATPKSLLNVRTLQFAEVNEDTPYETRFESDETKFKGERKVITSGTTGKKLLKVQIVKENGVEVNKTILAENVIAEPKTEVVAIGSKPLPEKVATGHFRVPAFGSVSSRYGYRWGRMHEGIDISGNTGDPIYAADGGKVIFSGWESGYGYLVKINHGNGYTTYYGHNSKNLVKVGQKVGKGDKIALVGSTGHSTGPHVHFEVRKNDSPVDPMKYLK